MLAISHTGHVPRISILPFRTYLHTQIQINLLKQQYIGWTVIQTSSIPQIAIKPILAGVVTSLVHRIGESQGILRTFLQTRSSQVISVHSNEECTVVITDILVFILSIVALTGTDVCVVICCTVACAYTLALFG